MTAQFLLGFPAFCHHDALSSQLMRTGTMSCSYSGNCTQSTATLYLQVRLTADSFKLESDARETAINLWNSKHSDDVHARVRDNGEHPAGTSDAQHIPVSSASEEAEEPDALPDKDTELPSPVPASQEASMLATQAPSSAEPAVQQAADPQLDRPQGAHQLSCLDKQAAHLHKAI